MNLENGNVTEAKNLHSELAKILLVYVTVFPISLILCVNRVSYIFITDAFQTPILSKLNIKFYNQEIMKQTILLLKWYLNSKVNVKLVVWLIKKVIKKVSYL